MAIALGVAWTGFAYVLYFRLIQCAGPTRAIVALATGAVQRLRTAAA